MYKTLVLDLTNVVDEGVSPDSVNELVGAGQRMTEIAVLSMPGGADFRLCIGRRNMFLTVSDKFSMAPTGTNQSNEGLYFANPNAQAGVVVEIVVVFFDADAGEAGRLNVIT